MYLPNKPPIYEVPVRIQTLPVPPIQIWNALRRLTRYQSYSHAVVITTFLGIAAGHGEFGWRLLVVFAANWLVVCYAFMINDVEDAEDDAQDPAKVNRNPVSAGILSYRLAYGASYGVAALSAFLFMLLGGLPMLMGLISLLLSHLYSWKPVRLKAYPVIDLISHCMMLAGLQFLAAYFAFEPKNDGLWLAPFVFVTVISLYGQMSNQFRDLENDKAVGLRHTGVLVGPVVAHNMMLGFLGVAIITGALMAFVVGLIPLWVEVLLAAMAIAMFIPAYLKARQSSDLMGRHLPFWDPCQNATALALIAWFVLPWLGGLVGIGR
jgi:4-hydroxybenzoate polyprenyltransferase